MKIKQVIEALAGSTDRTRRTVIVPVAGVLLAEILLLPESATITNVFYNHLNGTVELLVDSPNAPETKAGVEFERETPVYTTVRSDCGHQDIEVQWALIGDPE